MNLPARECGECSACCVHLRIDDEPANFHKEAHVTCEHLLGGKCDIYSTKPNACTDYFCMWRLDDKNFSELDRPDRSGVLVTMTENVSTHGLPAFEAVVINNAGNRSYWIYKLIRRLARKWIIFAGKEVWGPYRDSNLIRQLKERLNAIKPS